MPMKTLLLADGSSYLYRAFHAMPNLRSPHNEPTGAIYGVVNMLQQLMQKIRFDYSACVFDAPGKTFRHTLYPDYKAHRPSMPDDLISQIEPTHRLVKALGWPVLSIGGVEADDVIGTLTKMAEQQGHKVIISTGDKDFAQLVSPQVSLINTMNNEILDEAGVKNKFGVRPDQIVDYLTLMGDATDNVPGVSQCGPKTALKWLDAYQCLDNVIEHADSIKGVVGEKLREALNDLPLSRTLVTIRCDVDLTEPLPNGLDDLAKQPPDVQTLKKGFEQYGFRSWVSRMSAWVNPDDQHTTPSGHGSNEPPFYNNTHYHCITTFDDFAKLLEQIQQAPLVSLDTETTSLNPLTAQLVGISFSWKKGEAYYVPLKHDDSSTLLDCDTVLKRLQPWLESNQHAKIGQNLKYDRHVFANHGIALSGIQDDVLLASYVLESHLSHNLYDLAQRHLHKDTTSYESICGKGAKQIPFSAVPLSIATAYAAEDADIALQLNEALQAKLSAPQKTLYQTIELPIATILFNMERRGVLVDRALLAEQSESLGAKIASLEHQIYALAGQPFNINSPKQLQNILFEQLNIATQGIKKTPTGDYSTNESVLEKLAFEHPLARCILDYRMLAKLKSTYTDKLPTLINANTGRIHTHYAQAVVVTGRLASNEPNLQNIPIRTEAGRHIREAFIAPPGFLIVSADYSQIELRIMAHLSGDATLCQAFLNQQDIHQATAAEVFDIPLADVTDEQRRYAKSINFGLIYGMGIYGLAQQLGISQYEAKQFMERYFARYPQVAATMANIRKKASDNGYVDTLFGRRVYQPDIRSLNYSGRARAERAAINAPIQGTAADLIKKAMIATDRWLRDSHMVSSLIMQVHDELVLEVAEDELWAVKAALPSLFASVAQLDVPLVATIGVGNNWEAAH